jgi:hypothetical protein
VNPITRTFSLPGKRLEKFTSLFISKDERQDAVKEMGGESGNWKDKLKARAQAGQLSAIKNDEFWAKLTDKFSRAGIPETRLGGAYTVEGPGQVSIDLAVTIKHPSFLYQFIFEEYIKTHIRIICTENDNETTVTIEYPLEKFFKIGTLIATIILFFMFLIPGIIFYSLMKSSEKLINRFRYEIFEPTLKEVLSD